MKVGEIITLVRNVIAGDGIINSYSHPEPIDFEIVAIIDNAVCLKTEGSKHGLRWLDKRIIQEELDEKKAKDSGVEVSEI